MPEQSASLIVALVAIGMGLSFLAADPSSRTSRALAVFLGVFGLTVVGHILENLDVLVEWHRFWPRLHAAAEAATCVFGFGGWKPENLLHPGYYVLVLPFYVAMTLGGIRIAQLLRLELGLGIGVASGFVTVGTIGGAGRLEYAAIGPPVNLAARLCDHAESGQVLVDRRTVGLVGAEAGEIRFAELDPVEFKGFSKALAVYEIAGQASAPAAVARQ